MFRTTVSTLTFQTSTVPGDVVIVTNVEPAPILLVLVQTYYTVIHSLENIRYFNQHGTVSNKTFAGFLRRFSDETNHILSCEMGSASADLLLFR